MKAAVHQNSFPGIELSNKSKSFAKSNEQQGHEGHSLAYFIWVYVAIFLTIMVAVIIAERFYIQ